MKLFTNTSASFQFFFAIFIILVVFLATLGIGIGLAIPILGINASELGSYMNTETIENIRVLKYFQTLQTLALFVFPAGVIAYVLGENVLQYLSLNFKPKLNSVLYVFITILVALPIMNVLIQFNESMKLPEFLGELEQLMRTSEDQAKKLTEAIISTKTMLGLFSNILIIAILPALGEELIFRGVFQRIFTQMTQNYHWGIFISAFFFSALHIQFYGFLPRLLLGMYFGYLMVWSKSLWLPILAHFFNNALAVVFYFYYYNYAPENFNPDTYGTQSYMLSVLSALLVVFLIYFTYKIYFFKPDTKTVLS